MFENIYAGWATLKLDDFSESVSYLTNIPSVTMSQIARGLKGYAPVSIYYDCEGYDFILVVDNYNSYIILNKSEKPELFSFEYSLENIATMVYNDISNNFKAWIEFDTEYMGDKSSFDKCKSRLLKIYKTFSKILISNKILNKEDGKKNIEKLSLIEFS